MPPIISDILRGRSYQRLFVGFILIIFFDLLILELLTRIIISLKPIPLSYSVDLDWKSQIIRDSLTNRQTPYVLAMGSSVTNQNLNPELLQYQLQQINPDLMVFNLAHSGGTTESNLYLLNKVLSTSIKPSLIVYDYAVPWQFNSGYLSKPDSTQSHFFNYYTGRCLANRSRDLATKFTCRFQKYSSLLRHWQDLPLIFKEIPNFLLRPRTDIVFTDSGNISRNGWIPRYIHLSESTFNSYYSTQGANFNQKEMGISYLFSDFKFDASPFEKFIEFTRNQNIPILIVWYPEHPFSLDYYVKYRVDRSIFRRYFKQLEKNNKANTLDLSHYLDSHENYSDPDHLNTLGANRITQIIANHIIHSVL